MKKNGLLSVIVLVGMVTLGMAATAFAGQWMQNDIGWWYQNEDGSYPAAEWKWIDSDGDGVAECYYFYGDGYMAHNNDIEKQHVNDDGQWVIDDKIQHKTLVSQEYKSPDGTFYINGQYILTMPESYQNSYYHSVMINPEDDGTYWMSHITGRHPGSAILTEIKVNVPTRYELIYKGYVGESGTFTFDGNDTIYLQVDGANEVLTFIRK